MKQLSSFNFYILVAPDSMNDARSDNANTNRRVKEQFFFFGDKNRIRRIKNARNTKILIYQKNIS